MTPPSIPPTLVSGVDDSATTARFPPRRAVIRPQGGGVFPNRAPNLSPNVPAEDRFVRAVLGRRWLDSPVVLIGGFAAVGAISIGLMSWALMQRANSPSSPNPTSAGPLRQRVLEAIRANVPLSWDEDRFVQMLGGRSANITGAFNYYHPGYGTTCAIFVAWILALAGAAPDCINRGIFYKPSAHADVLMACARERKARRPNIRGIEPGDIYYVAAGNDPSKWHIGFVWKAPRDGWIVTADGGQTDGQGRQAVAFVRRRVIGVNQTVQISDPTGTAYRVAVLNIDVSKLV